MRPRSILQSHNQTPIVSNLKKCGIDGTLGMDGLSGSTRIWKIQSVIRSSLTDTGIGFGNAADVLVDDCEQQGIRVRFAVLRDGLARLQSRLARVGKCQVAIG